ncbi:MAG: hypothetical protein GEU81_16530, partial [Nitriliruptorales bacterium]|nr:hypothetical protein [Nitriliruptorales bacterium]
MGTPDRRASMVRVPRMEVEGGHARHHLGGSPLWRVYKSAPFGIGNQSILLRTEGCRKECRMRKRLRRTTFVLVMTLVTVLLAPSTGWPQDEQAEEDDQPRPGFLTAPRSSSPEDIARDFIEARRQELGLTAADTADLIVTDAFESSHAGVTHVYLRQRHQELEVVGANTTVNIADDGSVVHAVARFMPDLAGSAAGRASLDAPQATRRGAEQLGLEPTSDPEVLTRRTGPERETVLSDGGVSEQPIPAELVYQPTEDGELRLAWNVEIEEPSGEHWWNASIDAQTGELLATVDYVDQDDVRATAAALARPAAATTSGTGTATSTTTAAQADGASYRVYGLPLETPNDGERSLVTDPADPLASPFGWHDTDGVEGPESTRTQGNNVHAYTDHNNSNTPDPVSDPDGGPELVFDFPLDLTEHPHEYSDAAVTNLFYLNNIIHDVFYRYGFDEASGNFQVNNYGRGGLGGDDVRAEAQDGGGMNNANFAAPSDGNRPRMQMFLWGSALPNAVTVDPPSPAAGSYQASGAAFGPELDETGLSGDIALVDDGAGSTSDACEPLVDFPSGAIALLDRGVCPFTEKVSNAQDAGAVAVIVANDVPGAPITIGGADPTITIPSAMVTLADGDTIKDGLPATGLVHRDPVTSQIRDGDLDAGIIIHEYGHGISNRLTGGPNTAGCLSNQEQMGEGWSDWLAVALLALPSESGEQPRGIGTYALFQPDRTLQGIRPTPYSTD